MKKQQIFAMLGIDNIANTSNDGIDQFSESRLTTAAILAFLPNTGPLGIHNFVLKRYKKGTTYIIIGVLLRVLSSFINYNQNLIIISYILITILGVSLYVRSILEGIQILKVKEQKTSPSPSSFYPPAVDNSNIFQSSNPAINTRDASYYAANQLSPAATAKTTQEQDRKLYSAFSVVATMVPIVLWTYFMLTTGSDAHAYEPGAAGWWLMPIYYFTVGLPLTALAIGFGIAGLKTNLRWLSIVSFSLKAAMIIAVALFFMFFY